MKKLARHETLKYVADIAKWDWVVGPTLDKGHRHQLYHEGLLHKAGDATAVMPGLYGPEKNSAAFGISIKGLLVLDKLFNGSATVEAMKKYLIKGILEGMAGEIHRREKSYYVYNSKDYHSIFGDV